MGALLKWFLNEGIARWQMATGTTLLEGWVSHLGRWVRWAFIIYFLPWAFFTAGALASACGVAGTAFLPLSSNLETWFDVDTVFAVSQDTTFDQLAVSAPLFLKLGQRGGVHDRAAGSKLVNMNVYQSRCLLTEIGRTARKCRSGKIRDSVRFQLCEVQVAARRGFCAKLSFRHERGSGVLLNRPGLQV